MERTHILREGSWNLHQAYARCSYRDWSNPVYWSVNIGVRVSRHSTGCANIPTRSAVERSKDEPLTFTREVRSCFE